MTQPGCVQSSAVLENLSVAMIRTAGETLFGSLSAVARGAAHSDTPHTLTFQVSLRCLLLLVFFFFFFLLFFCFVCSFRNWEPMELLPGEVCSFDGVSALNKACSSILDFLHHTV